MKKILMLGNANSIHFRRWYGFLKAAGVDVTVLSLTFVDETNRKDYSSKEPFYDFSIYNRIVRFWKVVRFLRKNRFDYINVHYFRFSNALQAFFIKQKFVYTCWGSDILINYKKAFFLKKAILNYALNKAYAITFDSASVGDLLSNSLKKIHNRLKLIYWGVDSEYFSPIDSSEKIALREKFKLPQDAIIILSIRNLRVNYNIDKIVEWFNNSISSSKLYLYIKVPPAPDRSYLKECKKLAANNQRIVFNEDFTPYEKLNEIYRLADVNIHFPQSDATPVTMLEALSSGNSIIASSKIDAYKELASNYDIKLTTLEELTEQTILNSLYGTSDKVKHNREFLLRCHSQVQTIKSLNLLLN